MAAKKEKATKSKAAKVSYKEVTLEELLKTENNLRKELFEMRFKLKVSNLSNVKKIRENKRNIARILTEIRSRELAKSE